MKCKVFECQCQADKNSLFCKEHKVLIPSICSGCGNQIMIKPKYYKEDEKYYCRSCSSKIRISEFNKTDRAREIRLHNAKTYNMSEKGKMNREKGLKIIHENYTGSEKHINQVRNLGLIYGPKKRHD